jgi:ribosomal protein L40E
MADVDLLVGAASRRRPGARGKIAPVTANRGAARAGAQEPTHHCIRCGADVPLADSMCRACNPAGLRQPAATQAHGTVLLGIALAVVGLAVAATLLVGGVGPFRATLQRAVPDGDGLVLTLAVENRGSRAGAASCRVWDPAVLGNPPVETYVRTPEVAAGRPLVFDQRVRGLGTAVRPLAVDCDR